MNENNTKMSKKGKGLSLQRMSSYDNQYTQQQKTGSWNINKQRNNEIGTKRGHNPSDTTGYTPDKKEQRNNEINISNLKPLQLFYNSKKNSQSIPQSTPQKKSQSISYNTPKEKYNPESLISPVAFIEARPPISPRQMTRSKENIKLHISNETLKDLIIELIKFGKIKLVDNINRKKSLNNLFSKYKSANSNTPQPILQTIALTSNFKEIPKKKNMKLLASGAHASVFNVIDKPYVLKIFKREEGSQNSGIETNLLPEFYGCLMNANLNLSLSPEHEKYFNKILQMYAIREVNHGNLNLNLISILEKCDGDLITFLERLTLTDINELCLIFNEFCKNCAMMLFALGIGGLIHRDIKPDNILYIVYPNGKIQFKLVDFSTMVFNGKEIERAVGTDAYTGPIIIIKCKLARLNFFKRSRRLKKIENLKESIKLNNSREIDSSKKKQELESLEESGELDIGIITAHENFLSDYYSMGLTEFIFGIHMFNIFVPYQNCFPFTNEESTYQSKIDIWSNKIEYDKQVQQLRYYLEKFLQIPKLSEHSKIILRKDVQMIETLLLSNNPFPNRGQNLEKETRASIEAYLKFYNLIPSTN
jgi:serine/threonine protein kinase